MEKRKEITGFRDRLESAIFESNLDISEICRRAEMERGTLWNYRFMGIIPNAGSLVGLCKALNVSADWLLGLSKDKKEVRPEFKPISKIVHCPVCDNAIFSDMRCCDRCGADQRNL